MAELIKLPTVFVQETDGQDKQIARIGTITRANISDNNVVLEFAYNSRVPPIPNQHFQVFTAELSIENFEFSRTHWAIKNVNLFERNTGVPIGLKFIIRFRSCRQLGLNPKRCLSTE